MTKRYRAKPLKSEDYDEDDEDSLKNILEVNGNKSGWIFADMYNSFEGDIRFIGDIIDWDGGRCSLTPEFFWPIKPQTLCRFSGFYDSRSNPIYENDIIKIESEYSREKVLMGKMFYSDSGGRWLMTTFSKKSGIHKNRILLGDNNHIKEYTIVGNTFDNPEVFNNFYKTLIEQ